MSTKPNGIATAAEVNVKIGSSLTTPKGPNGCPTYSQIIATGKATIAGSYIANRCVKYQDISSISGISFRLTNNNLTMRPGSPGEDTAYTRVMRTVNGVESDVTDLCTYTANIPLDAQPYISANTNPTLGLGFYFSDPGGFVANYPFPVVSIDLDITYNSVTYVGKFYVTASKS